MFLNIAANATSRLSGVDSDPIFNALSGIIDISTLQSLQCIFDELAYIKNNFIEMDTSITPYLQSITVSSTCLLFIKK